MTRILITDDLPQNLYLLESLLKGNGFDVVPARNGADALKEARKNPPDLVITDILMPVMDGFELCRQWKADSRLRSIPLIFYTATYTDPKDEQLALSLGAERFIIKPQKPEVFMERVREVLKEARDRVPGQSGDIAGEDTGILKQYNEALFRKLEKKVIQLEGEIAERTRAEDELRENKEFLDAVIENIPAMLFIKDSKDLRFVRINKGGEDLLGYSREMIYGKTDRDFFPAEEAEFFMEKDREALKGETILDIPSETILTKDRGQRIVHTKKIPIFDNAGVPKYLLGISEDITERVYMEDALRRATDKLSLLTGIALENIRNAAFCLSGYLELDKEVHADDVHFQYLQRQSEMLQKISDSITFSRNYQDLGLKPPQWQNVLVTFLYAVSHTDILRYSRNILIEGLEVYADPLLEKVFFILAENVVHHGESATEISLYYLRKPEGVTIVFEDNGAGIPESMKDELFSRKNIGESGMSLFLAAEILSITGIIIRETGEPGKGARFEMEVPKEAFRFVGA